MLEQHSNSVELSSSMKTFTKSLLVLILATASTSRGQFSPKGPLCQNPLMNDTYRQTFLNFHNRKRLDVALGREPNRIGMFNSAREMYLLGWNCELEYKAQIAAACRGFPSSFPNIAVNMQKRLYTGDPTDLIPIIIETLEQWWGIGRIIGVDSNNIYHSSIETFGKMVFSETTKLGCAYQICFKGADSYVNSACLYNAVPRENEPLWQTGEPCKADSDCTYPKSICAGGVCFKRDTEDDTDNNMCPSNAGMTDSVRETFLRVHNLYRSRIARGLETTAEGNKAPTASRMHRLHWNCELEKLAMDHAKTCQFHMVEKPKENLFISEVIVGKLTNFEKIRAAKRASHGWWNQLKQRAFVRVNFWSEAYRNYANMAIGDNKNLGCAIYTCFHDFTVISCHYSYNETIYETDTVPLYEIGNTCASCSSPCKDGLCP